MTWLRSGGNGTFSQHYEYRMYLGCRVHRVVPRGIRYSPRPYRQPDMRPSAPVSRPARQHRRTKWRSWSCFPPAGFRAAPRSGGAPAHSTLRVRERQASGVRQRDTPQSLRRFIGGINIRFAKTSVARDGKPVPIVRRALAQHLEQRPPGEVQARHEGRAVREWRCSWRGSPLACPAP